MTSRPSRGALPRRRLLALAVAAGVALSPALVAATSLTGQALPDLSAPATRGGGPVAYPSTTWLTEPTPDPTDAALRLGLAPYHDLSRRINALQATSDRVSAEVLATTAGGREVVMVTLTAPESPAQTRLQQVMRDRIVDQPAQAAGDRELARSYKVPVFVNANIHGNEWEGTDAALRFVEEWATSQDPSVQGALASMRIHLVISMNPDGRVTNSRQNTAGFDLNRDLVTASQPEVVGVRDALIRTQPTLMIDLHGYVNGTLVEPTTPPHGENYEYDLFVKHALPNALGVEEAILELGLGESDGVRPPQVPLRDWAEGWDDWPPIFTPQYAALHGAVSHTIEVPLRVNNRSYNLPQGKLRRLAATNTDIAHAAITATVGYAVEHRSELVADQIEIFRRGRSGERQTPVEQGLFGVIGPEDVYLTDYPRAFVIPIGSSQRSAPAAARLVDHLVANDVEVSRLTRPAILGGTPYPLGTYVVDLHQAKRGMANTILGVGTDISSRVDATYDISGWSHALLWGADVVSVPEGQRVRFFGESVAAAAASGTMPPSSTGWTLRMDDPADVRATGHLLAAGVALEWLDDGSVLVPAEARPAAAAVVADEGVVLAAAPPGAGGTSLTAPVVVGVSAGPEERWALQELGLTVEALSTSALNDGLDLSDLDALYVSSGLVWRDLDEDAQAELQAFVADGGGIVAHGAAGVALNEALGLLDVSTVRGRGDANGVVAVENSDGPLTAGAPAHTFVYSPLWFTELGPEVLVDQRYAADPLVSGHWRPSPQGGDGPESAAGQALVISGTSAETGSRAVLMGSEPLFRAHPKGQYATVARALVWSSLSD
ncbi:M14 family zinc carboxypeptidase [Ornithinimicrobium sp. LYQ103]|uniref:M14 family zinc carboxypeptidase n=1 Tax=Ornithinimicrobium sp. LYQ103 TaxID=3378796 RepID=UPI00385483FF